MSDMIERVAKALATCAGAAMVGPGQSVATREFGWKGDGEHLEKYVAAHWKEHIYVAGFVIDAMREPTAEMLLAAAPFPMHLVIERNDVDYTKNMEAATASDRMAARSTYQTMIDAALSPS